MFIDDFVWLTDIAEKLETKHHVSQDEAEESVLKCDPSTGLLNQDIEMARMYTQQVDRRTVDAI
jgi:hypothetical protein